MSGGWSLRTSFRRKGAVEIFMFTAMDLKFAYREEGGGAIQTSKVYVFGVDR